ncbi:MAG: hypothetical protein AAB373_06540 [Patescibacteria group bacterium]
MKRRTKIIWWSVFGILAMLVWYFIIGIESNRTGSFYNKKHNAIWLGHEWVDTIKSKEEVYDLVNNLKKHQIDTVFVHSGPIEGDGGISPKVYKYAPEFINQAKEFDDSIQYQAWMGQIRSKIDLDKPEIRAKIVKQAKIMTELVGFDGIHYDIEPVWDEDNGFIELLKETRENLTEGKKISVALAEFIPQGVIWISGGIHNFENHNSELNYSNVAKYADQIVTMVYDTGINHDWLYLWLVKEQTIWVTNIVEDREVFIAIPSYDEVKPGFNPGVENIGEGLAGIIQGLNNIRSNEESFAGVAIYAYWEMDENEWETYEKMWVK